MKQGLIIGYLFVVLITAASSECILSKPVKVHQICGQVVSEKGGIWPGGKLRLTRAGKSAPTIKETIGSESGEFTFADLPGGKYWLHLAPGGNHGEVVPVQVWLSRPSKKYTCQESIQLTVSYIPEACVSPTLVRGSDKN
jgi:hypothetical protein